MASPFGAWYFKGPINIRASLAFENNETSHPSAVTTEEDPDSAHVAEFGTYELALSQMQYHVEPNNEIMVSFLTAFAKAVACIPALKEAALWSLVSFRPPSLEQ
jgi:hypothetical protein